MRFTLFLLVILFSCNPVNRVLNSPKMYRDVRRYVIANGDCINDTTTIVKDSVVYEKGDFIKIPCPDFVDSSDGIVVRDSIIMFKKHIKTITKTVYDRGREMALKDSLIIIFRDLDKAHQEDYILRQEIRKYKHKLLMKTFLLIGIALALSLWVFRKPILMLIK